MKSIVNAAAGLTARIRKISVRLAEAAAVALTVSALAIAQSSSQPSSQTSYQPQIQVPEVRLDANGLAPRPIEELTGSAIARVYALAWRDQARALEFNQAEGLSEEFVGFAKDRLIQRISEQKQTGVRVRIVDHGHHLKAVFYSSDGTAMQLLDRAQLEIETFDGDKLLNSENAGHEYIVLLTPGADRWYVRDLEEVSGKSF